MSDKDLNSQDTHPEGKAPSDDGTSPDENTPTITKAQHEEAIEKAVQKARIDAGRDAKSLEEQRKKLDQEREELESWRKERDEAELASAGDDKSSRSEIERRQQLRREQAEIAKQKRELESRENAVKEAEEANKETLIEIAVWQAANQHGVDPTTLKQNVTRFKLTDKADIEELAKTLAGSKSTEGDKKAIHADSSDGRGGSSSSDDSPRGLISQGIADRKK